MTISKITSTERDRVRVYGLPDKPGLTKEAMQQRFDGLGDLAIDKLNEVIDGYNGLQTEVKETIDKEMADLSDKVEQIASDQIPVEYVQAAVEEYVNSNESELATKVELEESASQLSSEIGDVKNEYVEFFEFSGAAGAYNFALYKHSFESGTELCFETKGAKCNIVGYSSASGQIILVTNATEGNIYTVTTSEKITSIGVFMVDEGSVKIYLLGEYVHVINDKISATRKEFSAKVESKENVFTSQYTELANDSLYMTTSTTKGYSTYPFTGGCRAIAPTNGASIARISGYGWDSTYNYFLYGFLDENKNLISHTTKNGAVVKDLEIEIPEGASYIIANGRSTGSGIPSIEVFSKSNDFKELYYHYENLNDSVKPKLLTLGDSITMLGTGDRGWIRYFIEKTGCELVANVAMNSAVLSDYTNTVYDGNPQQDNQTNNVLGNQVQKIINNGYEAPDIIMIAIGTNAGINITLEQIKGAYYDDTNTLIPLENVDRTTNAGAYRYAAEKLHELYPDAIIFWCTPIMAHQSIRSAEEVIAFAESLRIATEYSGQIMIDTIRCGINGVNEVRGANGEYLIDGLHPNANGAKKIGYYNASKVKPFLS